MKIVCFDVDMTLLDHATMQIPESALKTLEALRAAGHRIILSTGRDMKDVFCAGILDEVRPDGLVHCNGACVEADGQVLLDTVWSPEEREALVSFCEKEGLVVGAIYGGTAYCIGTEKYYEEMASVILPLGLSIRGMRELPQDAAVHEIFYCGYRDGAQKIEEAFPGLRLPMYATGNASDVIREGVSKAGGIRLLMDHYGCGPEDVIAVGDSNNDIEMLEMAGLSIAMGNASPKARAAADHVTSDIAEDGIYRAFRHFDLIPDLGIG